MSALNLSCIYKHNQHNTHGCGVDVINYPLSEIVINEDLEAGQCQDLGDVEAGDVSYV